MLARRMWPRFRGDKGRKERIACLTRSVRTLAQAYRPAKVITVMRREEQATDYQGGYGGNQIGWWGMLQLLLLQNVLTRL